MEIIIFCQTLTESSPKVVVTTAEDLWASLEALAVSEGFTEERMASYFAKGFATNRNEALMVWLGAGASGAAEVDAVVSGTPDADLDLNLGDVGTLVIRALPGNNRVMEF